MRFIELSLSSPCSERLKLWCWERGIAWAVKHWTCLPYEGHDSVDCRLMSWIPRCFPFSLPILNFLKTFLHLIDFLVSISLERIPIFLSNCYTTMCLHYRFSFNACLLLNVVLYFDILHQKLMGMDNDPSSTWTSMSFLISQRTLAPASSSFE